MCTEQQMMSSDAKKPHGPGSGGGGALTPSMGAMSRSYSARSGGLVNELCLLGRDEVPSLVGDMVLLTKLVMLWQLLEREGPEVNQGAGRAGRDSLLTPQCSSSWKSSWRPHSRAWPSLTSGCALSPPFQVIFTEQRALTGTAG